MQRCQRLDRPDGEERGGYLRGGFLVRPACSQADRWNVAAVSGEQGKATAGTGLHQEVGVICGEAERAGEPDRSGQLGGQEGRQVVAGEHLGPGHRGQEPASGWPERELLEGTAHGWDAVGQQRGVQGMR
jgi:hypothetical protein